LREALSMYEGKGDKSSAARVSELLPDPATA
jgi:hypothetical protein